MPRMLSKPPYVFDNDCLASFLWVKRTDLLNKLFPGQILVPSVVVEELSYMARTKNEWVYRLLATEIAAGNFLEVRSPAGSPEAAEFLKLTTGRAGKVLGRGEAAVIAYVRFHGGTVASNNLSDVGRYCKLHSLDLITTEDILCYAFLDKLLTEKQGNVLWEEMKKKRRRLPQYSFSEALRRFLREGPRGSKL